MVSFGDDRLPASFWAKCSEDADGCWRWRKPKNTGYGYVRCGNRNRRAHRVSYEALIGSIPDGLVLDHLCRVRCCVNPAHLEPVAERVNILRGTSPSARAAVATHCVNGHEFTPENTKIQHRPKGTWRLCVECKRKHTRENSARYRQAHIARHGIEKVKRIYVGCLCGWRGTRQHRACECDYDGISSCSCAFGRCPKCNGRVVRASDIALMKRLDRETELREMVERREVSGG